MEKLNLNSYKMNEAIRILKEASMKSERSNFTVQCNNCTLDIVCGGVFNWHDNAHDNAIEVALFTEDGNAWNSLEIEEPDGTIFTIERPVIHNLPLICFPAFVKQFKELSDADMPVVWDAWDTISLY